MTIATTDGTAALLFDDVLELQGDADAQEWPCEIWRDVRGRFLAIFTAPAYPTWIDASGRLVIERAIASALRAACAGYCDLIIEYRPGRYPKRFFVSSQSPVQTLDRADLAAAGVLVPII